MHDGKTHLIENRAKNGLSTFLEHWQATLVILSGNATGTEYALDQKLVRLGRGPGVDLAFDDPTMSVQHAAIEFRTKGFELRDLDSTNGTRLNGGDVDTGELKHGDRIELGEHVFQFVLEERQPHPRTYVLPENS